MRVRSASHPLIRVREDASKDFLGAPARWVAHCSSQALIQNYHRIREMVPGLSVLPMLKADGYGHGASWAGKILYGEPGLYGFGVATLEEAADLRRALGSKKVRIIVFSGAAPWTDEKGRFCEQLGLTPVICTDTDWASFSNSYWPTRVPYELEFNTGMNRLGLSMKTASRVAKFLRNQSSSWHPSGVFSHLAQAEEPDSKQSQMQAEKFQFLKRELSSVSPSTQFHLANSAAIWNHKYWSLSEHTDAMRPGISLYGVPPWFGAPQRGILPVLSLRTSVVAVHRLKPGESVGYGFTYTVSGTKSVCVAILAAGYADGLSRVMSHQGGVVLNGVRSRFAGIISMDLSAVLCPENTRIGDWAEVLGPETDIWEQARAAQTIPYQLLTSLTPRVQRVYG